MFNIIMDGLKANEKRDEKGLFLPGTAPGPGRPKGQSLKEYWRSRFQGMTDEEKAEFSIKIGLGEIWRMAEGNPAQEQQVSGSITVNLVDLYGDKDSTQSEAGAD